jgi:hypothetical protein
MRRLLPAVGLLAAVLAPGGLVAQEPQSSIRQLVKEQRLKYDAAKEQYQADSAQFENVRHNWNQLIEQRAAARERGEDDEVSRLNGDLEELTGRITQLRRKRDDSRKKWIDEGESLVGIIDNYLGILDQRIQTPPVGSDDEASSEYTEYERRLESLEEELLREDRGREPMPDVTFLPEDSPRERNHKLTLIERRIEEFTDMLADLERDIEALQKRQEREQRRKFRQASIDRFDDDQTSTGGDRTNVTGDTGVSDSTTVAVQPLEDRIAALLAYREDVVNYLADLKAKYEENGPKGGGR